MVNNTNISIDGIWIATPTDTHKPTIEQIISIYENKNNNININNIINNNKNNKFTIGLEKPVCMIPCDTEKCYNICLLNNISLFCSFQRRKDPNYNRLYEDILSGKLGKLQSFNSIFRDHPIPPIEFLLNGGDLSHDCGVHDIDYARYINKNNEIIYVSAIGNSFNKILKKNNVLDLIKALLLFDNGVMYHMEISRTSTFGYDIRFECFGSKSNGKIENINETSYQIQNKNGINNDKFQYSFPERFENAFRLELEHFRDVMNGIKTPFIDVIDACRATQVAEACRLSIEHKKPVYIQYDKNKVSQCIYTFDNPN